MLCLLGVVIKDGNCSILYIFIGTIDETELSVGGKRRRLIVRNVWFAQPQ